MGNHLPGSNIRIRSPALHGCCNSFVFENAPVPKRLKGLKDCLGYPTMVSHLKIAVVMILLTVVLAAGYVAFSYQHEASAKVAQSGSVFLIAILLDTLIDTYLIKQIKARKARFLVSKSLGYAAYLVATTIIIAVWIEQASNLLFTVGVVGAGIAVALQRPITNLAGFVVILATRAYTPGDRIEIDGDMGDVIDIEFFHTTVMETGKWTMYDQFTGRIKTIPNYYVLEKVVNNYSRDFGFIWEEIMVPVTYASDWVKARKIMLEIAGKHSKKAVEEGEGQLKKMTYKYLLEPRATEPAAYVTPTDNWIELRLRFIVDAHHRRSNVDPVWEEILRKFKKEKKIRVSSKTSARTWDAARTKEDY
ncbi:mechanosensitive ion channel [Candidatus Micrarchaeota archaeon]|nr:mechanosensitive ion channel [Candidatus Micrarchaeota archaeon]